MRLWYPVHVSPRALHPRPHNTPTHPPPHPPTPTWCCTLYQSCQIEGLAQTAAQPPHLGGSRDAVWASPSIWQPHRTARTTAASTPGWRSWKHAGMSITPPVRACTASRQSKRRMDRTPPYHNNIQSNIHTILPNNKGGGWGGGRGAWHECGTSSPLHSKSMADHYGFDQRYQAAPSGPTGTGTKLWLLM